MKKIIISLSLLISLILLTCSSAFAYGTKDNWSLKLAFSTSDTINPNIVKTDLLPLIVGVGPTANEVLKPPVLVGKTTTRNDDDTVVYSSLRLSGGRKGAIAISAAPLMPTNLTELKKIQWQDKLDTGYIWAIDLYAEETGQEQNITLNMDKSNLSTGYVVSVFIPGQTTPEAPPKLVKYGGLNDQDQNLNSQVIYKTSERNPKTIYLRVGSSQSLIVASYGIVSGFASNTLTWKYITDPQNVLVGAKVLNTPELDNNNIGVTATANASGIFTLPISNPVPGTYTITLSREFTLSRNCFLTLDSSGFGMAACPNVMIGNISDISKDDMRINMTDLGILALCYGTYFVSNKCDNPTKEKRCYMKKCDINGDGKVNMTDLGLLKLNYGKWKNNYD